ncbi:MAG TPA: hypothetical protein VFX02_01465 [Gammaproteobacteria bacterium]|nr:hypothetical protein [Gammaproteobacteria bacterium]
MLTILRVWLCETPMHLFPLSLRRIILCLILLLIAMLSKAFAGDSQIQPGQYITKGGWGYLTVKQESVKQSSFDLVSVVDNGHTCLLDGELQNNRSILETDEKDKPCIVDFRSVTEIVDSKYKNAVSVSAVSGNCFYFCGTRGYFDGTYLRVDPVCELEARRRTQEEFKVLYKKKSYSEAYQKLEPLLSVCADSLEWLQKGWIQNDLAITQYKLGDLEECRRTLQTFTTDLAKTEENIREEYPPRDADAYIPILSAARFNLRLCNDKKKN